MRLPLLPILIVLVLGIVTDIYIYRRLRVNHTPRGLCVTYVVLSVLCQLMLAAAICLPKRQGDDSMLQTLMWMLFAYFSVYLPKYIYALLSLAGRLCERISHRRVRWPGIAGAVIGAAVFVLMWHGALVGRYSTEVKEVEIAVEGLPAAFDGYRIVQISDLHTGSYAGDTAYLASLVDTVNGLGADVIVFTGDLVNRRSRELRPYMTTLSRMHAPGGVWSVMGNHDYGDYYTWPDEAAHLADADSLKAMQGRMGWRMLNNSHTWLRRGTDSVALIGVENIGDPPFRVYGDLGCAYPDRDDDNVKILLTHNPQHWVDSISASESGRIALTLSGHTHAMQMELLGLSPAAWRYPTWGGLYTDSLGRHLYVNIGIGEVALPARIGQARPEVTVLTLRRKQ